MRYELSFVLKACLKMCVVCVFLSCGSHKVVDFYSELLNNFVAGVLLFLMFDVFMNSLRMTIALSLSFLETLRTNRANVTSHLKDFEEMNSDETDLIRN